MGEGLSDCEGKDEGRFLAVSAEPNPVLSIVRW